MTTVAATIARSLRLIGVHDPGEPLEATDAQTGIEAMNAMCRRWEANGSPLGWSDVANPSDALPSPPEYDELIAFNLAVTVAPEYDASVPAAVATFAAKAMDDFLRDCAVATPIEPILDVPFSTAEGESGGFRLGWPGNWY